MLVVARRAARYSVSFYLAGVWKEEGHPRRNLGRYKDCGTGFSEAKRGREGVARLVSVLFRCRYKDEHRPDCTLL